MRSKQWQTLFMPRKTLVRRLPQGHFQRWGWWWPLAHSLSEIAWGITGNLISRAADVVLKERRRLVLLVRETPLHAGHLKAMAQVTENGAIVMPPVPALYTRPHTVDDVINHTVGRALDLFHIQTDLVSPWGGLKPRQ